MKKFIFTVAVFSCLLPLTNQISFAKENLASDCAIASVKDEYKRSKSVFVGKVISVKEIGDFKIYEFRVEKYWKGVKNKIIKIRVGNTLRWEPNYLIGKKYMIYASADQKGILQTYKCSRGSLIEFAKEDFKVLGKGKIMR